MSLAQKIATTSAAGLRPLGTPGQRSFEVISRIVARDLSPAHAAIFAEPVTSERGELTDWYTALDGRAAPLAALDPAARKAAEARLAALMDDIRAHARSMLASPDPEAQRLAEALENALAVPGDEAVFVLGGTAPDRPPQPVIVTWAMLTDGRDGLTDRPLTGWAPRRRAAAPPRPATAPDATASDAAAPDAAAQALAPAPAANPGAGPRRGAGAWSLAGLCLLLALLTAGVLYLLLPACGLAAFGRLDHCPTAARDPGSDLLAEAGRHRGVLENRVALLEREVSLAATACAATPFAPVAVPESAPEPVTEPVPEPEPDEIDDRLEREDAAVSEAEVALVWDSVADVDLYVTCPAGDEISYTNRTSAICSGRLDVDMNAGGYLRRDPVEHVYFEDPAPGRYEIAVRLFNGTRHPGPHPFRLRITFGDAEQDLSGSVSLASPVWTTTYDHAP